MALVENLLELLDEKVFAHAAIVLGKLLFKDVVEEGGVSVGVELLLHLLVLDVPPLELFA